MKKFLLFFTVFLVSGFLAIGHGVAIKDASAGIYFTLRSSSQVVTVYDQVSTTVTTQVFENMTGGPTTVKYAFPLHEEASATSLRWKVNNTWYTATFAPAPQDTTLPGGGGTTDPDLITYLGANPMYFEVPDTIAADSSLTVELTYVELLPYAFGTVQYDYPNNYQLIQTSSVVHQYFHFVLESQRNIDSIFFVGLTGATITNTGSHAEITYELFEQPANHNYQVLYSLAASQIGLYGYSTYLPDSMMVCDSLGNGYFTFIVEPDPDTTQVIQKVFTLIIDRSGSMSGSKIDQAKAAATFIVNHLNEGDFFNLISFDDVIGSFQPDHVPFNPTNKQLALSFINNLYARNQTDIGQAFHYAIEDYAGNDTTVANIIIFLTDGQPTAGLLGTEEILAYIQSQINFYQVQYLMINTFGIGMDANQQLLSLIASQNNGLSQFLLDNELEEMITQFFLMISNPVLLNISMTFDPPIVSETYPDPLPNLYIGQQLIVAGRYDSIIPGPVRVTLSGQAFGQTRTYQYDFQLTDSLILNYMFVTKLWAIRKIDHLYVEYFTYPEGSPEADSIKDLIVNISICYNVSSPFTHWGYDPPPVSVEEKSGNSSGSAEEMTIYPNPFYNRTTFILQIEKGIAEPVEIRIYDMYGNLVRILYVDCSRQGKCEVAWDGTNTEGKTVSAGIYTCQVLLPYKTVTGKLIRK
jgi:Ca-activated chloride channel homolog